MNHHVSYRGQFYDKISDLIPAQVYLFIRRFDSRLVWKKQLLAEMKQLHTII